MKYSVEQSDLLTVSEVAKKLRVDDTTARRWIQKGILEAVILPHVGKRLGYRVKKSTLDDLLQVRRALADALQEVH